MARPRISDDTADHITDIYREHAGQNPPDFETALATVLELASAKLEDDSEWYPGKYAKKTMQMVLDDTAKRSARSPPPTDVSDGSADFKAILDDDGRIEIPVAERRALGLDTDDLLEVTVREFEQEAEK